MSYCRGIIYIWESASKDELNCCCSLHMDTLVFATSSRSEMLEHLLTHEEDIAEMQASINKVRSRIVQEKNETGDLVL